MALIVKELNKPTCCKDCEFYDVPCNKRYPDCPLIEIPKGTRLIDANNRIKVQSGTSYDWVVGKMSFKEYSIDEIIKKSGNPEVPVFFSEEE